MYNTTQALSSRRTVPHFVNACEIVPQYMRATMTNQTVARKHCENSLQFKINLRLNMRSRNACGLRFNLVYYDFNLNRIAMNITQIREAVEILEQKYAPFKHQSLREMIHIAYILQILDDLTYILNDTQIINSLQAQLKTNWTRIQGSSICYTAIPENDVTLLLCDIAELVAEKKNLNPIEVLMPGVSFESCHPDYPDLDKNIDIKTILKTHILGNQGKYLLPVKLLTKLSLSSDGVQIPNPYFDFQIPQGTGFVEMAEYKRLIAHSALTQAVFDTKHEYEVVIQDSSLLGQLNQLCQQLSVNMVGNLGSEDDAGAGLSPAIMNFMAYYNRLEDAKKEEIPPAVKAQIDLIFQLVTDETVNNNSAIVQLACSADRRKELKAAMLGHEETLSQISLRRSQNKKLLKRANKNFEEAKAALEWAIDNNYHCDHDRLDINPKHIDELNISFSIFSDYSLEYIALLNPTEIRALFTVSWIKNELRIKLGEQLETLSYFVTFLPAEKLIPFLEVNRGDILTTSFKTSENFSLFLQHALDEKAQIIFDLFKDQLPHLINSPAKFKQFYSNAPAVFQSETYEMMKHKLPLMIESNNDLELIIAHLPLIQRITLRSLNILMNHLNETASSQDIKAFASALISEDNHQIKTGFNHLTRPSNQSSELIKALSTLEPRWLRKINTAVGLNMDFQQLTSPKQVEARIKDYLAPNRYSLFQPTDNQPSRKRSLSFSLT